MSAGVLLHRDFQFPLGHEKMAAQFIQKLKDNPKNPSLKIKPLAAAVDRRVRTGRVNDQYRAVLVKIEGTTEQHFLLVKIDNHDEANDFAARLRLETNPSNGVIELITDTPASSQQSIQENIESRAKQLAAEQIAAHQAAQQSGVEAKPTSLPQQDPQETLTHAGICTQDLREQLGISPSSITALEEARDEEILEQLLSESPAWEKDAILGVLAGMSIAEVKEDLGLDAPVTSTGPDSSEDTEVEANEKIIAQIRESGLWVEPSELDLKEMLETGTFAQWRTFLHPSQAKAVTTQHSGSARIVGGAGTGKTVVLLHRAKFLLDQSDGQARVLLTTFNRDLSNQLKAQMSILDPSFNEASISGAPGLWISGIDSQINSFIRNARKDELDKAMLETLGITNSFMPKPLWDHQAEQLWEEAAELNGEGLSADKKQPRFLEDEFRDVVLTHSINNQKDYLRVSRSGRRTPLGRNERKIVWSIIESFVRKCSLQQSLSFAAIAVLAAHILEHRDNPYFDHVLIDEAQDFHAGHWRYLTASVKRGPNDIFIAEDSHQRIYGHRLALSKFGIETRGRATKRLRLNYRTTAQNLSYASAILENTEWIDSSGETDNLHGYRSVRTGPRPAVVLATTANEELESVASIVQQWIAENRPSTHIGVLSRSRRGVKALTDHLAESGVTVSTERSGVSSVEAQVSVMTMHNSKGMEFSHVILTDVSEKAIPRTAGLDSYAEAEQEDALQRERALLYVAASRARDELVITMSGQPSSLLPS